MERTILFLMSDTGGGHRASAQAIEEAVHHLYPQRYTIIIEDMWKNHTPWPFNRMPNLYGWITGPGLPLWRVLWSMSAYAYVQNLLFILIFPFLVKSGAKYLGKVRPDLIVSVHPMMNHLGMAWLRAAGLNVPFITIVTDMVTFHPSWICPEVTRCIVPTDQARDRALKFGMPPEKVVVCGQPVGLKFIASNRDKTAIRRQLGLLTDRYTIMVMGGGEGFGKIYKVAREIAQQAPQAQLVIVAGRNQSLKHKLEAVTWEIPTHIYGFVDNMPDLMRASDVLVTKAGPGTISEAFITGLPPVLLGYIPGQETGNVAYVQEHEAGVYARKPLDIAHLICEWMTPGNPTLQYMSRNAARLARPQASLQIANELCQFV
ncbi:MAG: galactosyldiacylglycerol synthase [Anaerolineae bacterium]|nr:galactosyldiacylglycerol synthase [Anaerolineae bacterium]